MEWVFEQPIQIQMISVFSIIANDKSVYHIIIQECSNWTQYYWYHGVWSFSL